MKTSTSTIACLAMLFALALSAYLPATAQTLSGRDTAMHHGSPYSDVEIEESDAPYLDDNIFREQVMHTTNNVYRAQHSAAPLTWNTTMAKWADEYSAKCQWAHSGVYLDNLAGGASSPAGAVIMWGDEREHYNYANPGLAHGTGHFTALVWKDAKEMGCGRHKCHKLLFDQDMWFTVCAYWPAVNVKFAGDGDEWQYYKQNVSPQISGPGVTHR